MRTKKGLGEGAVEDKTKGVEHSSGEDSLFWAMTFC